MDIQIEPHTLQRALERGATKEEIVEVLESGTNILGKFDRLGKSKIFQFNAERIGKYYEEKKVEVFYLIQNSKVFTVTVYVFYGKFTL